MSNTNTTLKLSNKAVKNYEIMKESIKGIHEVLKLVLNEKDTLYKVGMDNLLGLYDNFLQLMMNEYGTIALIKKIRHSRINIDIPLDDHTLNKRNTP